MMPKPYIMIPPIGIIITTGDPCNRVYVAIILCPVPRTRVYWFTSKLLGIREHRKDGRRRTPG